MPIDMGLTESALAVFDFATPQAQIAYGKLVIEFFLKSRFDQLVLLRSVAGHESPVDCQKTIVYASGGQVSAPRPLSRHKYFINFANALDSEADNRSNTPSESQGSEKIKRLRLALFSHAAVYGRKRRKAPHHIEN